MYAELALDDAGLRLETDELVALATPKSISFTSPSYDIRMLGGLMSRWMMLSGLPSSLRLLWA